MPKPKQKGRPSKGAKQTQMKLPETIRALARMVGNGDMTAGTEALFSHLPVFYRVKLLLENIASDNAVPSEHQEQAETLLLEMDSLEIERVYQEAVANDVITVCGKDGEPSAWIV